MHYKLRMIGVPIDGSSQMMRYKDFAVTSFSSSSNTLNNSNNDIVYNWVREAVAAGVIRLAHIPVKYNPADLLTNPRGPQKHYPLMKEMLV